MFQLYTRTFIIFQLLDWFVLRNKIETKQLTKKRAVTCAKVTGNEETGNAKLH